MHVTRLAQFRQLLVRLLGFRRPQKSLYQSHYMCVVKVLCYKHLIKIALTHHSV